MKIPAFFFASLRAAIAAILLSAVLPAGAAHQLELVRAEQFKQRPLFFEAVSGSEFIARGPDCMVHLTAADATLILSKAATEPAGDEFPSPTIRSKQSHQLRIEWLGANQDAAAQGIDKLAGVANHFIGNDPAHWRRNMPLFARVRVVSIYTGIDLVYYAHQSTRLEYDFIVQPGADYRQIAFRVSGADRIFINQSGELILKIGRDEIRQLKPVVYQESKSGRKHVDGAYRINPDSSIGFNIGAFDESLPLVIDPVFDFEFSTFLGGTMKDSGRGIAVNATGVYVTGETVSGNLIRSSTPAGQFRRYSGGLDGFGDAYVASYALDGTLNYVTYLGGRHNDAAFAVASDPSGNAYVTGFTDSADFPIRVDTDSGATNVVQRRLNTTGRNTNPFRLYPVDAFITKLDPNGFVVYSTYLGGNGRDAGFGIATDAAGFVYVTGVTESRNLQIVPEPVFVTVTNVSTNVVVQGNVTNSVITTNIFDVATNIFQPERGGGGDAFAARLMPDGSALVYLTYIGGNGSDTGRAIDVDSDGQVYITGTTFSPFRWVYNDIEVEMQDATNDFRQLNAGGGFSFSDAFVLVLPADGSTNLFSAYIGGGGTDAGTGISIDDARNIYVTGYTTPSRSFPTNVFTSAYAGSTRSAGTSTFVTHAFVTRFNADYSLAYSTRFGGTRDNRATGIDVDASGRAYVSGYSSSTNMFRRSTSNEVNTAYTDLRRLTNSVGPLRLTGAYDAFLAILSADATTLDGAVLFGGTSNDRAFGVQVFTDAAYLVGTTSSQNFPRVNPAQPVLGGARRSTLNDAFVSRIFEVP